MSEQTGFTQEQLVIYKLGQIESNLSALILRITDLTKQSQLDLNATEARTAKLEEAQTNYKIDRAKVSAITGLIIGTIVFFKELIGKWLGLSFLN